MVRLSSLRYEVLPSDDPDSEQLEDNAPDEAELSDPEEPSEDTDFIEELEKESCTAIVVSLVQCFDLTLPYRHLSRKSGQVPCTVLKRRHQWRHPPLCG
jgi:hypothetical protein